MKIDLSEYRKELEAMTSFDLMEGLLIAEDELSDLFSEVSFDNKDYNLKLAKAIYSIRKSTIK